MQQFDHEKLDVFNVALAFVVTADQIAKCATRGHADLADQIRRASTSIVTNLAEGAGEFTPKEKARFYRLSKRSATECAALVEIFHELKLIEGEHRPIAREALLRVVSMLVRMIHATEARERAAA